STISPTHNDGEGQPVPSRHATRAELIALARVVRDHPGTALEFLPGVTMFSEEQKALMADLSLAANRPLNWNVLAPTAGNREYVEVQLSATDYARARGAEVIALTVPQAMTVRLTLHSGFVFDALPGWAALFQLPVAERLRKLREPGFRKQLDEGANSEGAGMLRAIARWDKMVVVETFSERNQGLAGKTIGEIAEAEGVTPFDALVDVALADELKTQFMPGFAGDTEADWEA